MDAKQIIDEYENLFYWEKEEVKKHINRSFDLQENVADIVNKFKWINNTIDELDYALDDLKQSLKELNEHFNKK